MRSKIALLGLLLSALASRADAGVLGDDRIELRPPIVTIERLEPAELGPAHLTVPPLPVEHVPHVFRYLRFTDADELRGPIAFELPELGPEGLDLEIRSGRFLFKVGAEMVSGKSNVVITPRLDCDTRETYFWVRLQFDVTDTLAVFAESFQAAGAILGVDTQDATQRYVWDGYQLQLGARWQPASWVAFEGGPVLYALSATRQASGLGFRVGVRFEF